MRRAVRETLPIEWAPVPGNVPLLRDPNRVAALRRKVAPGGEQILGSFATYGDTLRPLMREVLPPLLRDRPGRVLLLLGRGGEEFSAELIAEEPALQGRIVATGGLPPGEVSLYLQATDVMVQLYDAGVTSRRGTLMAALEHGRAVATHLGRDSETIWAETGCVALTQSAGPDLVRKVEELFSDADARARLGRVAEQTYHDRFALARTIEKMLRPAAVRWSRVDRSGGGLSSWVCLRL